FLLSHFSFRRRFVPAWRIYRTLKNATQLSLGSPIPSVHLALLASNSSLLPSLVSAALPAFPPSTLFRFSLHRRKSTSTCPETRRGRIPCFSLSLPPVKYLCKP